MWTVLEVFKDPVLLSRVRAELTTASKEVTWPDLKANIADHIHSLPILQSVYAEVLRLRFWAYAARYAARSDVQIGG